MDTSDIIEISRETVWTEKNEQVFIKLMEIEVINGNRQTTTFSSAAWSRIMQGIEASTERKYKHEQLRNKFNTLRTRWRDFTNLLKETGVSFNATTGQVIASDDVWSKLYTVNKSAKTFRKKGCPMHESLCRIFGDTTATGSLQHPSTKIPSDTDEDETEESEAKSMDGSINKDKHEDVAFKGNLSSKRAKKMNILDVIASTLNVLSESSKRKVDMLEKRMSMSTDCSSGSSDSLLIECMNHLNLIEGLDDVSYSKVLQKFQEDPIWMRMFLHMPKSRMKGWILTLK